VCSTALVCLSLLPAPLFLQRAARSSSHRLLSTYQALFFTDYIHTQCSVLSTQYICAAPAPAPAPAPTPAPTPTSAPTHPVPLSLSPPVSVDANRVLPSPRHHHSRSSLIPLAARATARPKPPWNPVPNQALGSFYLPSSTRISPTGATHILATRTHSTADSVQHMRYR
jgi:hypothetical protein